MPASCAPNCAAWISAIEPPEGSPEDGIAPDLIFLKVPEGKTVKNRLHLDVLVDEGAISPEDLNLFTYADDPATAWEAIRSFYALSDPG